MKKEIWFAMSRNKAHEYNLALNGDLKMAPLEVEMEKLSPAARFIAEHITATRVYDEVRDVIDVWAESKFARADIDREAGKSEDYIKGMSSAYEDIYTKEKIRIKVSFPVYGNKHSCPEDVIEETITQLRNAGCARMFSESGDEYKF